ncbi:hypothetical protein OIU85_005958 [Salix viminalis]|uniref:Uncharacterized protein n=1 Tax=Salix viminalis TaxID=40686 RepID=A0A9Q0SU54_SALVM|nr:hypothetical protein OIU85_005958 [Salix viminalis]
MAATSPCSSSLSHHPLLASSKTKLDYRKRVCARISASGRESRDQNYFSGRIVDENMIVLRKRIHEMKMAERNDEPPSNWMGWEKRYFTSYDSSICEMMGFLQSQLMETRPSLALGFIALISLSVSMSTAMMFFQFHGDVEDDLGWASRL